MRPGWTMDAEGRRHYRTKTSMILQQNLSLMMHYVEQGAVELYTVNLAQGAIAGTKSYVLTVGPGQIWFDLPQTDAGDFGWIAEVMPDTVLASSTSLFEPFAGDGAVADKVKGLRGAAELIGEWLVNVTSAAVADMPPLLAQQVEPGTEIVVWESAVFTSEAGLVWVRADGGALGLWQDIDLPAVPPGVYVPLTRSVWAAAPKGSRLLTADTLTLLQQGQLIDSLNLFHRLLANKQLHRQYRAKREEQARMAKRLEQDRLSMEEAVSRFSAVADKRGILALEHHTDHRDPLLFCARSVCEYIGIELITPKRWEPGRKAEELFREAGIRCRKVALRSDWWREDNGPLLGFHLDGRPAALLPAGENAYELHSVAGEKAVMVTDRLAAQLRPFAYELYRPLPYRSLLPKDIARFLLTPRAKKEMVWGLASGLAVGLLGMCLPAATGIIIDKIIPAAEPGQLFQVMALLMSIAFASFGFRVTQSMAWLRLLGTWGASLHSATWDRLLNMPVGFFRQYNAGDLASRIGGVSAIFQLISGWLVSGMSVALFSVLQFGLLFWYEPRLAWLAIVLTAVYAAIFAVLSIQLAKHTRQKAEQEGRVGGMLVQLLANIPKLRVAAAEQRAFNRWSSAFSAQRAHVYRLRETGNRLAVLNSAYPLVSSLLLFWIISASDIRMNPGTFAAFHAAYATLIGSVIAFCASSIPLFELKPFYERIKPLMKELPETEARRDDPGDLKGAIELSEVTFRYDRNGPAILDHVSLRIRPGEYVAVVGASGSGKSTLLRLIIGFEKPEQGAVYFDGKDLSGLELRSVRRQCGVVLQNGRLWAGDIAQNIIGQSSEYTVDDAWNAAQLVGMDEEIGRLPMGMHTVLSEGGGSLSGGQRQRILIARSIVHKPRIVLLDEATSALDQKSQEKITAMLRGMSSTRIVIAHRLSTIIHADRIIVMDKGKIVQQGSYEELLQQEGLFARLAARQVV
ncbi:NHLP bacteriocin export ABC transporter permease/ATPase subunit [Paenibacillus sp. H1-7]|uniref:NHLP bacteriocin export ABC transporter permease/ATPase subunit n=1 Tax=Paenibacillus sp. H1-7 TaxID=2282849 RepID=UPI001EF900F6|nr:NHLP bacteriocin export ABC transporter permease/ATPase subunit [Paenibacillus sp. H1-7]ULL16059.1 NHLP bacteriocin export ABC transporter permease/ATPase subunit [Paenibacillus sp. H1-7]